MHYNKEQTFRKHNQAIHLRKNSVIPIIFWFSTTIRGEKNIFLCHIIELLCESNRFG